MLYFFLISGIKLHHLSYKNLFSVEELYIKIDKKIVLEAKKFHVNFSQDSNNTQTEKTDYKRVNGIVLTALKYLSYFQTIDIIDANVNKQSVNYLKYKENKLFIDTDKIMLNAALTPEKNRMHFDVEYFIFKPKKIYLKELNGYYIPDILSLKLVSKGKYYDIDFDLSLFINEKSVLIESHVKKITSLNTFARLVPQEYASYLKESNISELSITNLSLLFDRKESKIIQNDANITLTNLSYKKSHIHSLSLSLKDKELKGVAHDILFNESNLSFSTPTIRIYGNYEKLLTLELKKSSVNYAKKLKSDFNHARFSLDIKRENFISSFHDVKLSYQRDTLQTPLLHLSGNLHSLLSLKSEKGEVSYQSLNPLKYTNIDLEYDFKSQNLNSFIDVIGFKELQAVKNNIHYDALKKILTLKLESNTLLSSSLKEILKTFDLRLPLSQSTGDNHSNLLLRFDFKKKKNHIDIQTHTKNADLVIGNNLPFFINHANIRYVDGNLFIRDSLLTLDLPPLQTQYAVKSARYDLKKRFIESNGTINEFNISRITSFSSLPQTLIVNLNQSLLTLKELNVTVDFKKHLHIILNKLSHLYPYQAEMKQYHLHDGNLSVVIDHNLTLTADINDTNQTLLSKNDLPLKKLHFTLIKENQNYTIFDKNRDIELKIINNQNFHGNIKGIDVNITTFFDTNESNASSDDKSSDKNAFFIDLNGTNTTVTYKDAKLYSKRFSFSYKDGNFSLHTINDEGRISTTYKNKILKIEGFNIQKKTINALVPFDFIKDPKVDFIAIKGKETNLIDGFAHIKKGYIKELKLLKNIVAFFNTIPSLVTFSGLGYTEKGYKIKDGAVEFIYYDKVIHFKKLDLKGDNINFRGNGYVDLNKWIIKMNLDVDILVKLVKDIPVVNYILLGKDGGLTVRVNVDGNLSNPTVSKNTLENIIESPFRVLYRVIKSPMELF